MFGLTTEQITIVKNILRNHLNNQEKVYVFGSRASEKYKPFSDLDLCIVSNQDEFDFNKILDIKTDYEYSD
jgi:predicted nucleotidyltransferase